MLKKFVVRRVQQLFTRSWEFTCLVTKKMIMHDQFFSEVMLLESACRSVWEDYFKTLARLMAKLNFAQAALTNTQWAAVH